MIKAMLVVITVTFDTGSVHDHVQTSQTDNIPMESVEECNRWVETYNKSFDDEFEPIMIAARCLTINDKETK